MRIRNCSVRVILRQSWLLEDPQRLSDALIRLVTDVLLMRLSTQVDSVGDPLQFGVLAMKVVLPAPVVLSLVDADPSGSMGRRLASFSAEVAVHNAVSDALRTAFEQATFQRTEWSQHPDGSSRAGSHRAGSDLAQLASDATEALDVTGSTVVDPSEEDPSTVALVSIVDEQLVAAVSATLLAATRLGRLRQLLRRAHPAIAAEWLRLLSSAGWRPLPSAASLSSLSLPLGVGDDNGTGGSLPPGRREMPAGGDESQHGREVISRISGAGPDPRTPEGGALGPARLGVPPTAAEVEAAAHAVLRGLDGTADNATIRLEAATAMAARLHLPLLDSRIWQALDRVLAQALAVMPTREDQTITVGQETSEDEVTAVGREARERGASAVGREASQDQTSPVGQDARAQEAAARLEQSLVGHPSAPPEAMSGGRAEVVRREAAIASVLPFLLVGPLDDLGVLDVLTAALAGWLARPPRGLRRRPRAQGTAAPSRRLVAAHRGDRGGRGVRRPGPPAGRRRHRAAGAGDGRWWPVVEEALTAELVDLRARGSPLVVTRSPGGLVAADADGLAPLLWDGDHAAVRRLWERCGRPPVLADPSLATWRARPGNDPAQVDPLGEVVALAGERPGGRADLAPELDAPISFVAGVALAALAWELWQRHGERTHPAMAVRRLGDLDGRVSLEPDRVIVRMPLGRRHADLRDSGLLRTVTDVPWLDGRAWSSREDDHGPDAVRPGASRSAPGRAQPACSAAVSRQQQEAAQLDRPDLAARSITDRQVMAARAGGPSGGRVLEPVDPAMAAADLDAEAGSARRPGRRRRPAPARPLSACFGLTELDRQALVAVAAPELDRGYERIYAYLCDEFDRRHPSVELLMILTRGLPSGRRSAWPSGPTARYAAIGCWSSTTPPRATSGSSSASVAASLSSCSAHRSTCAASGMTRRGWQPASRRRGLRAALGHRAGRRAARRHRRRGGRMGTARGRRSRGCRHRRRAGEAAPPGARAAAGDPQRLDGALREAAIAAGVSGALLWLPVEPVDDPPRPARRHRGRP